MLIKAVDAKLTPLVITIVSAFLWMSLITCSWITFLIFTFFFYMSFPAVVAMLTEAKLEVEAHIFGRHFHNFISEICFLIVEEQSVHVVTARSFPLPETI